MKAEELSMSTIVIIIMVIVVLVAVLIFFFLGVNAGKGGTNEQALLNDCKAECLRIRTKIAADATKYCNITGTGIKCIDYTTCAWPDETEVTCP